MTHEEAIAGSGGGFGRPGNEVVDTGAALTTTMRWTPLAVIAAVMARVPFDAIPKSALVRGPRPDNTASAPSTADASAAGSGDAKSAVTVLAAFCSFCGLRATAVTS